jgi:hypothetical protein
MTNGSGKPKKAKNKWIQIRIPIRNTGKFGVPVPLNILLLLYHYRWFKNANIIFSFLRDKYILGHFSLVFCLLLFEGTVQFNHFQRKKIIKEVTKQYKLDESRFFLFFSLFKTHGSGSATVHKTKLNSAGHGRAGQQRQNKQ